MEITENKIKQRRQWTKYTKEFKAEVVAYANENSAYAAAKKYDLYMDQIKYWMDPKLREKSSIKGKIKYREVLKNDPEYIRKCKEYSESRKNTPEAIAYNQAYVAKNKERIRANIKRHRQENIEHYKQRSHERYIKDRDSGKLAEDRRNNPILRLKHYIREGVRRALFYGDMIKDAPSITYLGCTIEEFRNYITSKFLPGMTWDNHGRGPDKWHLDHIIPLDVLNEKADIDMVKRVCHYTNYQPLWEIDNLSKNNKRPDGFVLQEDTVMYGDVEDTTM